MKTRGLIIITLFITLCACEEREQYIPSSEIPVDSFELADINLESRINYYPTGKDMVISYVSNNCDKVFFYSVDKKICIDSLPFDRRDMEEQYYIDKNKNIYVYKSEQNTLLIRDSNGNEKSVYKIPEFIYHSWDTFTRTYAALSLPLQVIDSTIIMNNLQGYHLADKRERTLYFKKDNLSYMKVVADSLVKIDEFGTFPKFYHENYIDENWPIATRTGNSEVYYMFSNANLLYKYNLHTGQTDTFEVNNLSLNKTESYNIDRIADFSYTSEYEIKVSSYLRLLYDEKTGEFIVFQMLPVKRKSKEGMLYLYEDKPVLLNLVDTDRNVYKKIHFNNHVRFNLMYAGYYNGKVYLAERFSRSNNKSTVKIYAYTVK